MSDEHDERQRQLTPSPPLLLRNTHHPQQLAAQFTSLTLLEKDKNMSDVYRKLSRDFLPTLQNAVLFWPLVSVVNSVFVPVLSRPIFSSFMGVFWNVYISYQANHNGMEVGEMSVVYRRLTQEQGQGQEEIALVEAVAAEEKEKTAEKVAVTVAAVAASDVKGTADLAANSVAASAVAGEGKPEATAESSEGGASAAATPPVRKRRGRIVRRTSVVSM